MIPRPTIDRFRTENDLHAGSAHAVSALDAQSHSAVRGAIARSNVARRQWIFPRIGGVLLVILASAVALRGGAAQSPGASSPDWSQISPDGSGMQVDMPGDPKLTAPVIRPLPDKEVTLHLAMVTQNDGKVLYLVGYHDLDFVPQNEQKKNDVLEGGVKGTVLNTLGKLTRHETISLSENPGRGFDYVGNRFGQKVHGKSRIFLVGARVYQLTVLHTPEIDVAADAEKFFASFQLLPAKSPTSGN